MTLKVDNSEADGKAPRARDLLAWYDRHRRRLPWRALPGERADPYRVWLSEIMLQQTNVKAAAPYFARFLARWPRVEDLAEAPVETVMAEWAGLGYYARARNMHAAARVVAGAHGGRFPDTEAELRALPGVGEYTAAAIAAIAFGRKATVVDGNVERVVARLFAVETAMPAAKPELRRLAATLAPDSRPGDFAQAMMDLGATICTPRRPACGSCPWDGACRARETDAPETYPRKRARKARPVRFATAFLALRADGRVLLRTRPPRGLLGGMSEVPTSPWIEADEAGRERWRDAAPMAGEWRMLAGTVEHTFSHFHLTLTVRRAEIAAGRHAPEGARWVPLASLDREALPSVMRKVLAHVLERREGAP